jgi:hypothetical protein
MVRWIFDVLGLIRCGYGPYELCLPSLLDSSTAVHCGLLWLYHVNTCFCLEGKFRLWLVCDAVLLITRSFTARFSLCSPPLFSSPAWSGT